MFQKKSPLLKDLDYLIDLRNQMGMSINHAMEQYVPNGTKCMTWQDVKKSQMISDVIIKHDNYYGMMIILASTFCGGFIILALEHLVIACRKQRPTQTEGKEEKKGM